MITTPAQSRSALEWPGVPTPPQSSPSPKGPRRGIYLITHELGLHSGDSGLLHLAVAVLAEFFYDLVVHGSLQEFASSIRSGGRRRIINRYGLPQGLASLFETPFTLIREYI